MDIKLFKKNLKFFKTKKREIYTFISESINYKPTIEKTDEFLLLKTIVHI